MRKFLLKTLQFLRDIISVCLTFIKLITTVGVINKHKSFYINDEKMSIDTATLVSDLAEINNELSPTRVEHIYRFEGNDIYCEYNYEGLIRKKVWIHYCLLLLLPVNATILIINVFLQM